MHRFLIIAAVIILPIGIGMAVYFYFFTNTADITVAPMNTATSLPIGEGIPSAFSANETTATTTTRAPLAARLNQISSGPVVTGAVVIDTKVGSSTAAIVSYIERQSGNIFTYHTNTGTITRTSNKTIPGIQSATWLPDASLAFVRYLSGTDFSTINTYALHSNGSGGFFLAQNLTDLAVSSTSVLTLASGINGSTASVKRPDGTNLSEVFSTPLSSLRIGFAGKSAYLAYTKPSATLAGNAFIVDSSGHFSRIAGPIHGLVALASHTGKWVLVSSVSGSTLQMKLVNTATNEVLALPVATIADKCVWTADDSVIYCGIPVNPPLSFAYPDDWYQGAVSFSDRIWKIDVASRYAQLILDFSKETKGSLDAQALAIDPLATELVFMNKSDGSLWGYAL